jgi:hypothetical protein
MAATTRKPPYVSDVIWEQFFRKLRAVNIPPQFSPQTLTLWGVAKGQEGALYSALVFLGMVSQTGETTEKMKWLQQNGDRLQEAVGNIIDDAYSDLTEHLHLDECSPEDLRTYFAQRHSNASAGKMVRSFVYWARLAGWNFECLRLRGSRGGGSREAREKPPRTMMPEQVRRPAASPRSGTPNTLRRASTNSDGKYNFDPVALAEAMETWDAEKMKLFFENIAKLREGANKQ